MHVPKTESSVLEIRFRCLLYFNNIKANQKEKKMKAWYLQRLESSKTKMKSSNHELITLIQNNSSSSKNPHLYVLSSAAFITYTRGGLRTASNNMPQETDEANLFYTATHANINGIVWYVIWHCLELYLHIIFYELFYFLFFRMYKILSAFSLDTYKHHHQLWVNNK